MSENTITIDEATGLPKLPEGLYWEVRRLAPGEDIPMRGHLEGERSELVDYPLAGYYLLLCALEVTEGYRWRSDNPKAHWWNREPKELSGEVEAKTRVFIAEIQYICVDHPDVALTPEKIRKTAQWIMDEDSRRRSNRELVGKYPPNKLG